MKVATHICYYIVPPSPKFDGKYGIVKAKQCNFTNQTNTFLLQYVTCNVKCKILTMLRKQVNYKSTHCYMQLQVPHDYKEDFPAVDTTAAVVESRTVTFHLSVTYFARKLLH